MENTPSMSGQRLNVVTRRFLTTFLIGVALLGGAAYWGYREYLVPKIRLRNYQEMLRGFCAIREVTAEWKAAPGELPGNLADLARYSPGGPIPPEVLAADFSSPKPVPFRGYFFRLLRSSDCSSHDLGLVAIPSGSSLTFKNLYLWTGSNHRKSSYPNVVPTHIPNDEALKLNWSTWCD